MSTFLIDHLTMLTYLINFLFMFKMSAAPCLTTQTSFRICSISCKARWTILELGGGDSWKKNQRALLDSSSLQGLIPWDSSKQMPEEVKICTLKVQGYDPAFCLALFSQKFYRLIHVPHAAQLIHLRHGLERLTPVSELFLMPVHYLHSPLTLIKMIENVSSNKDNFNSFIFSIYCNYNMWYSVL